MTAPPRAPHILLFPVIFVFLAQTFLIWHGFLSKVFVRKYSIEKFANDLVLSKNYQKKIVNLEISLWVKVNNISFSI